MLPGHRDAAARSPTRSGSGSPTRSRCPGSRDEERRRCWRGARRPRPRGAAALFEERLAEQTEAHHGGNHWVGTGGTSAFGHSGLHPGGIRVGGESRDRSAVKVAGERRYRGYRTDEEVGVRQFELALRRLRQLSSRNEGVPDELDLDETIEETADNAGRLSLVWRKSRKNAVKVAAADGRRRLDAPLRPPSAASSSRAVNRSSHFKDLRFYYFHNCVYDWLYLDTTLQPRATPCATNARPARAVRRLQAHPRRRRRHGATASCSEPLRHHLVGRTATRSPASSGCAACAATSTTPSGSTPSPRPTGTAPTGRPRSARSARSSPCTSSPSTASRPP